MKIKVGENFDPEIHQAITQIPAPKKKLVGKIIDTVEQGYKLGEIIIRFPKVVVGK
jgi:molecular chaperone GrpE